MASNYCAFCGKSTEFLAHSPELCLTCGDAIQQGLGPDSLMNLAKEYARLKVQDEQRRSRGGAEVAK